MHQIFYDEKRRIGFVCFTGWVKGAEAQRVCVDVGTRSRGEAQGVLIDYRRVTRIDLTETDGAMARINSEKLRATGINLAEFNVTWVTNPENTHVNEILLQRLQRTARHRTREGMKGSRSAERSLDKALMDLGLPKDFVLPF